MTKVRVILKFCEKKNCVVHYRVFDNHRTKRIGSEASDTSEISANLRRLESARELLDVPSTSSLVNGVTGSHLDVLPSPRVSPEMWRSIPDVVVNTERGNDGKRTF